MQNKRAASDEKLEENKIYSILFIVVLSNMHTQKR